MKILVIADHDNTDLKITTLNTVSAALKLSNEVHMLVAGYRCNSVVQEAEKVVGISKILLADSIEYSHQLAENLAPLIVVHGQDYSHLLAPATTFGKDLMPRVAALLDVHQISDISDIQSEDTFVRPIYAGNAFATVRSSDHIKVITVRCSVFPTATLGDGKVKIEEVSGTGEVGLTKFVGHEMTKSERPDLTCAKIVISGGRGMQSSENFALLERIADKLGAAVGATRAAVDAGYVSNDYQVGQTGTIVAPDLYIAVGISGAIQHLAGMKDSKVIVAINRDEDAPIFQVADYGLVADLFNVLPNLEMELEKVLVPSE